MSDPIDARFLREMVRELSSEEPKPIDWERVEERLFAKLDQEGAPGSGASPYVAIDDAGQDFAEAELGTAIGERISEVGLEALSALGDAPSSTEEDRLSAPLLPAPYAVARDASLRSEIERPRAVVHVPPVGSLGRRFDDGAGWAFGDDPSGADPSADARASDARPTEARLGSKARAGRGEGGRTDDRRAGKASGRRKIGRADDTGSRVRRYGLVGAMVAAAACFAFVLGGLVSGGLAGGANGGRGAKTASGETAEITAERWVDAADVPMAPGLAGAHDLAALRAGDMIEATAGAVSFAKADKVSWTLSPGGRVFVRSGVGDPRQVLVLESGSIRAEVQSAGAGVVDPFVIEAGETRVAVQDTLFSVTRSSKGIMVDVERGLVIVGPREELGLGSGRLLHASESGVFSLDGGRTFKSVAPERAALVGIPVSTSPIVVADTAGDHPAAPEGGHADVGTPPSGATSGARRGGDEAATTPRSSDAATTEAAEDGTSKGAPAAAAPVLREGAIGPSLDRCFQAAEAKHRAGGSEDVVVTMRSTLRLRVAEDGAIQAAAFNPPLRSDLQACAVSLLSSHVEGGARTIEIPIEIHH